MLIDILRIIINTRAEFVILNGAQRSEESLTLIHIPDPSLCSG